MRTPSLFLSALCCFLLICSCGGRGSSQSSSRESSSKTIQLQDYLIRLVPEYSDDVTHDYVMEGDKLLIVYSPTHKEVCGTVERIDGNAFEVGVGGDYQNGGKIYPENAAIFRRERVIGRVKGNPYRFAVFDVANGRIYQNTSDYENRDIADVEYLKFSLNLK